MKLYRVVVIPAQPAWNDGGHALEIPAPNKAAAIKYARREVQIQCLYGRPDGRLVYRAVEIPEIT